MASKRPPTWGGGSDSNGGGSDSRFSGLEGSCWVLGGSWRPLGAQEGSRLDFNRFWMDFE
eukprot:7325828-Karenia_brevis.AAC.1